MNQINIKRTKSSNTDFTDLIKMLDNDLLGKYVDDQNEYNQYNKIEKIDTVVIAYDDDSPIGCGCFKPFDKVTVEIKRMFLKADYRGKGISKIILRELENWSTDLGFSRVVLETGKKQLEAIALYKKSGFLKIDNYGPYKNLPNSICFEKKLV